MQRHGRGTISEWNFDVCRIPLTHHNEYGSRKRGSFGYEVCYSLFCCLHLCATLHAYTQKKKQPQKRMLGCAASASSHLPPIPAAPHRNSGEHAADRCTRHPKPAKHPGCAAGEAVGGSVSGFQVRRRVHNNNNNTGHSFLRTQQRRRVHANAPHFHPPLPLPICPV